MEADDTDRFAKTSLESFDVAQGTDDVASKWDSYAFKHALAKVIVDLLQDKCNEESLAFHRFTGLNTWVSLIVRRHVTIGLQTRCLKPSFAPQIAIARLSASSGLPWTLSGCFAPALMEGRITSASVIIVIMWRFWRAITCLLRCH